jgi:hypothetical protein
MTRERPAASSAVAGVAGMPVTAWQSSRPSLRMRPSWPWRSVGRHRSARKQDGGLGRLPEPGSLDRLDAVDEPGVRNTGLPLSCASAART